MTRSPRIPGLDASAKIRLAFIVLSGLLAFQNDAVAEVLPWMLLVLVLDLTIVASDSLVARPAVLNSMILALLCCSAAAAGAGYALAGPGAALLILVPAYHAGSKYGRFGFLLACVVATGAYQRPHIPAALEGLDGEGLDGEGLDGSGLGIPCVDTLGYRNPRGLPDGAVLVVGSGQSACQIAEELVLSGRDVVIACGRAPWFPR